MSINGVSNASAPAAAHLSQMLATQQAQESEAPPTTPLLATQSANAMGVELGGDVNAQIAAMMIAHSRDKRQHLGAMRQAEERNLVAQQDRRVEEMRKQADETRRAAEMRAIGGIANGLFTMGAGALTLTGVAKAEANAEASKGDAAAKSEKLGLELKKTDAESEVLAGAGKIAESGFDYLASAHTKAADEANANSVVAENKAGAAERRLDDLKEEIREARDLTRDAIDFFRGINETSSQVERAAVFQRA